jgi:hypothetical protein
MNRTPCALPDVLTAIFRRRWRLLLVLTTTKAIRDGLVKLRDETQADVILMDLQYVPAVLTPAKKDKAIEMVEAISELATERVAWAVKLAIVGGVDKARISAAANVE